MATSQGGSAPAGGGGNGSQQQQQQQPSKLVFIGGVSLPEQLHDAATSLQHARQDGFDYVVTALPDTVPLLNKSGSRGRHNNSRRLDDLARANVVPNGPLRGVVDAGRRTDVTRLESKWWSTSVVGMVSDPPRWTDGGSSAAALSRHQMHQTEAMGEGQMILEALTSTSRDAAVRREEANRSFWGMMEWASHMNIPAVILPPIPLRENIGVDPRDGGANKRRGEVSISSEEEDMFADAGSHAGAPYPGQQGRRTASQRRKASDAIDVNNPSAKEYARLLSHLSTSPVCASSAHVQLWVRVPLSLDHLRAFQLLLARCDHSPNVGCMLYISQRLDAAELPAVVRALHAFVGGGNVRAVSYDVEVFLRNKKGYPTLSKNHQFLFQLLFGRLGRTLRTLVEGRVSNSVFQSGGTGNASLRLHHLQYLRHLRSSRPSLLAKLDSEEAVLETPYLDNLQSPLQPLGDHLEYQTYETFERDPVKYKRYGEAVAFALEDGMDEETFGYLGSTATTLRQLKRMSDAANPSGGYDPDDDDYYMNNDNGGETIVEVDIYHVAILVVGAGRGPLVREAIDAVARVSAARASRLGGGRRRALHARVYAIEKNPSAVLYLQSLKRSDPSWNGGRGYDESLDEGEGAGHEDEVVVPGTSTVTVIGCDMREAASHPALRRMIHDPNAGADIVVSELLGSFGDNELSPECLDGVQACGVLKEGCVSIPQSYTAFIAPVSSARLHSEAKTQSCLPLNTNEGPASPPVGMQRAMETPYVVRSHAASQTHDEKPCWTFHHPHPGPETSDNMGTASDETDSVLNPSARAAKKVNNDRHAHLSFHSDPAHGAGMGCGYGAPDLEVASVAAAAPSSADSDAGLTVHGFLGSFHSVLYSGNEEIHEEGGQRRRSAVISIAPRSFSVGMFSWFPLFFPLREPLRVPPGATVNCSVWRRSDEGRVWYEWCAEVVTEASDHAREEAGGETSSIVWGTSPIHNSGGRSYHVNK